MKQLFTLIIFFLSISLHAQVGIGTSSPQNSSLLDISASDKGLLIPRVALTGAGDVATVASPAVSLIIFNTSTAGSGNSAVVPGFYFWNGSKWALIVTSDVLDQKENISNKSTDGSFASNSDTKYPSEKAVKTYVDSRVVAAGGWNLGGNSGTTAGTHFLGTTDNQDLVLKANSQRSGLINISSGNTAYGYSALVSHTGGAAANTAIGSSSQKMKNGTFGNTSVGYESLYSSGGNRNTAVGASALYSNTAFDNVAVGFEAMYKNTIGQYNTATGFQSLYSNTLGTGNTALGYYSLKGNVSGFDNIGIGMNALLSNTSGNSNQGVGNNALKSNTTGTSNNAFGNSAMNNNTTGGYNNAFGFQSLMFNTTGSSNNAFGINSLSNNTIGMNNNAFGGGALGSNISGNDNTAVGSGALGSCTSGSRNVGIGNKAGSGYNGDDMLFIDDRERYYGISVMEESLLIGKFSDDPASQYITINGSLIINNGTGYPGDASLAGTSGYKLPVTRGNYGEALFSNGDGTTTWGYGKSMIRKVNTDDVADVHDHTILIDGTHCNVNIALPEPALSKGLVLILKRIDETGNQISVTSSLKIDGRTVVNLNPWEAITVQSDGESWYIISKM